MWKFAQEVEWKSLSILISHKIYLRYTKTYLFLLKTMDSLINSFQKSFIFIFLHAIYQKTKLPEGFMSWRTKY